MRKVTVIEFVIGLKCVMQIKSVRLWLIIHSVNFLKQLCIMETPENRHCLLQVLISFLFSFFFFFFFFFFIKLFCVDVVYYRINLVSDFLPQHCSVTVHNHRKTINMASNGKKK